MTFPWQYHDLTAEIRRLADEWRPQLDAWEAMSASASSQIRAVQDALQRDAYPADYLAMRDQLAERLAIGVDLSSLQLWSGQHEPMFREFESAQAQITEAINRLALPENAFTLPERVAESLGTVEALYETARLEQEWVAAALEPYREYQKFALEQLRLAASASETAQCYRMSVVDSAADLLEGITGSFELSLLMSPTIAEPAPEGSPAPPLDPNIFRHLEREIEDADADDEDHDAHAVVWESRAAQVVVIGRRLAELVYLINVAAEREGMPAVFKPTIKTQYAPCVIATHVASGEESFSKVVDNLYFLLYEGSGEAARLTARQRKDTFQPLWLLKDLRRGMRHDLDHGDSRQAQQKTVRIGQAFLSLAGVVAPVREEHWTLAQVALYEQLVEMLESLLDAMLANRGD